MRFVPTLFSPLLANIALHGLENVGHQLRYKVYKQGKEVDTINGFRYADDVVFVLKPCDDAKALRERIDIFLKERGLRVKEAKTKLVNSTDGFDFLGWTNIVRPNERFITTPSPKATKSIKAKVKEVMKDNRFTLEQRIEKCGSVIRGWRNYHRFCDMSSHALWSISHWTWKFIRKQGRYSRYQTNKVIKKAFPKISWSMNAHIKVRGDKSPFDGDMVYWSRRENANYDSITAKLLKTQNYRTF